MSIEQANSILAHFGDQVGLPGIALDEHAYACLTFDDLTVNVEYTSAADALLLFSWLGAPVDGRESLFADLLEANLAAVATGGATFGYERATGGVVLVDSLPLLGLSGQAFEHRLDALLKSAARWRSRIGFGTTRETEPSLPPETSFMFLRA